MIDFPYKITKRTTNYWRESVLFHTCQVPKITQTKYIFRNIFLIIVLFIATAYAPMYVCILM